MSLNMDSIKRTLVKEAPEILTGLGIAGLLFAGIFAVKATPTALKAIAIREEELESDEALTTPQIIGTTWKYYIGPVILAGVSTACVLGGSSIYHRRGAALAAAYTLSESSLRTYKDKAVEIFGEKKEKTISDAIAKDKVEKHQPVAQEVILTERGTTLCLDSLSGRYFKSDIETIKRAVNEVNRKMIDEMYVSLNDYYYEIGLPSTALGWDMGWHMDYGSMEVDYSSQLTEEGKPCLVLDYRVAPRYLV